MIDNPLVHTFNDRDLRFMDEYMSDLRPMRAALAAGFAESTAKEAFKWISEQNPEKPAIAEEIRRRQRLRAIKSNITHKRVIDEIVRVGLANMADFTRETEDGSSRVVHLGGLPRRKLAAISEIQCDEIITGQGDKQIVQRRTKIKLHNKLDALDKLARHLRLYESEAPPPVVFDQRTINNTNTVNITTESAQSRYQRMMQATDVEDTQ